MTHGVGNLVDEVRTEPPFGEQKGCPRKTESGTGYFSGQFALQWAKWPQSLGLFRPTARAILGAFLAPAAERGMRCPKKTGMARLVRARIELISVIGASFAVTY